MKNRFFIKILSLTVCSLLGFAAFMIENRMLAYRCSLIDARVCFLIIPALFALWLFAFCRVRMCVWKWLVFAASYAVWFVLSYILWFCLIESLYGGGFAVFHYFGAIFKFLFKFFQLPSKENALIAIIVATLVLCGIGVYALFVAENILVRKLFRLSFGKAGWILLFCYPVLLALFSLPAEFVYILVTVGTDYFEWLLKIDTYFFSGTVIFGYMMTEGLFFIHGTR